MPLFHRGGAHLVKDLKNDEKATATYSSLRTGILSLTPGDHKCRLYCKGVNCRFCVVIPNQPQIQAIDGLYSTWITDDILAMSRLQIDHFEKCKIVEKFQLTNIKSVINLQESNEHSYCGRGNLQSSGFSYDPEELMRNGIYHYNFPLPDFEACSSSRLLDIVKVVDFALSNGKIAVHCHAGHGRTGMVIAAWMIYSTGITPNQAVSMVRSRRAKAVQSREQVETLHKFKLLIRNNGGMIIRAEKFLTISEYVNYTKEFLSKPEIRLYGKLPKIVYIIMSIVLKKCFEMVVFDLKSNTNDEDYRFFVECSSPRTSNNTLDEQLLNVQLNEDNLEKTTELYNAMVKNGLTISTMQRVFEKEDFRDLVRILDLFFQTSFHQLSFRDEFVQIIEKGPNANNENLDWTSTFWFLMKCVNAMPKQLHLAFGRLVSKWFIRSETDIPQVLRNWSLTYKNTSNP